MKILVYVEGPSDRYGLAALLHSIIDGARKKRIGISFHPLFSKDALLTNAPRMAADHLADQPGDWVFALPDLYPMSRYDGTPNEHTCFTDLKRLLLERFDERAARLELQAAVRQRFLVHCLKHDLEALILAAPDQLRERLGTKDALKKSWRKPVENQNDDRPPKRVVEGLFKKI